MSEIGRGDKGGTRVPRGRYLVEIKSLAPARLGYQHIGNTSNVGRVLRAACPEV